MTDTTLLRPDAWQQDGPDRVRLLATRCGRCKTLTFPPAPSCPACWERDQLTIESLPKHGALHSFTIVHTPGTGITAPYAVGLVDYEEGVRVCGRLRGGAHLSVGMPMETIPGSIREGENPLSGWMFQAVTKSPEPL
ncbi:Zn-ribbon domain-containing OB-fold protein [Nocardia sp. CA-119907]|uniref:Zn-ribbon domain-containing OB-fold protein n=1 Tax=Nocardia sp. CA-119907 TaxID=3239973 RepID=UPI003D965016